MKNTLHLTCLFSAILALTAGLHAASRDKTLDIYWIDSEGGGSTLIVTPNDESVLIDTGNPGGRDSARIIATAKAAGLTKIDYMLLTHFHTDHFGGAAEVAQQLPFGTIYQRAIPEGDPDGRAASSYPVQIKPYREITAKRMALTPGTVIPLQAIGGAGAPKLELRCIAADQKFVAPTTAQMKEKNPLTGTGSPKPVDASDNANSAVFVLQFGGFRFFEGGDLTWNLEEKLVTPYNLAGTVDVYQTNHHGLERSNDPLLIKSLAPTVAVMNNGPRKGGEAGTFAAMNATPSLQARYQMHKSMNVTGNENTADEFIANLVEAKPADQCTANIIKMSVAPDGKTYTISIPANGHSRTYKTKG